MLSAPTQQSGAGACNPLPPGPPYPQRVSLEGTHHGQKQGLLQESEECADQRLQSCEAAKLGGRVPAGATDNLSSEGPLPGFPNAPGLSLAPGALVPEKRQE